MYGMKTSKLKGKLVENGDTYERLAAALGITSKTLSFKINGQSEFNRDEIQGIIKRYNLSASEVLDIFFD